MIPKHLRELLKKQHYEIAGKHSAVQICRWAKNSIKNKGVCYKEKFYGIKSHQCCQMSPAVLWCPNKCLHCWRAIEHTISDKIKGKIDSPKEIIENCIKAQKKLLLGFKNHKVTNMEKYNEAQEPMNFAISLCGEPFVYKKIGELINELKKQKKTSFLVTNGLYPEEIERLKNKNQLPTQLYVSVNASNKKLYEKIHNSVKKQAWKKLNETLGLLSSLNCRTVFRINLIRGLNMGNISEYVKLIKKAKPKFIEIKGYMSVGFARQRLGYEKMPLFEEVLNFSKEIQKQLKDYKILDTHEHSRAIVLGKNKKDLKIKN
jgi:tRNA wybutosine-synthesizing protein 1